VCQEEQAPSTSGNQEQDDDDDEIPTKQVSQDIMEEYGYVQKDLTKDETEYLKLFEEEIEERLKHRRQMRRWEIDSGRGDFPQLPMNDIENMLILVVQNRLTNLSSEDVSDFAIALRMFTRSIVIQKKDIQMEYLTKRRWSSLEKKRAHIMIKAIDKLQKERRMMRSLEKFVGGRHYRTDL
ncbi:hypothetical protein Tco_1012530, partial [Tanacetum coccineum]